MRCTTPRWPPTPGSSASRCGSCARAAPPRPSGSRLATASRARRRRPRSIGSPRADLDPNVKNVLLHLQLRGASFAQDLARGAGLDTAGTLAALWELFWAGLVTPDTFSAIVAGSAPSRPEAPRPAHRGRRPRRGARRAPLARLPVIGRWSVLTDEEAVDIAGAIRALQAVVEPPLPLRRVRRLDVEQWDGRPIRESEAFDAFVAAGFSVDGPRVSWDGHPGPRWR